jgi:hypothetical protein
MTRPVFSRAEPSAAKAFYLDPNLEKTFVVVRMTLRPCARLIPYGRAFKGLNSAYFFVGVVDLPQLSGCCGDAVTLVEMVTRA